MLVALCLLLSACTLDVIPHEDESDHAHEAGTDEHDHADEGAVGVDHHGNPIYDEGERVYEVVTADGVSVEFTVENFIGVGGRGGDLAPRIVEGEHATLQFHVTDAVSGQPLVGLSPAAWLDLDAGDRACSDRVHGYLSGSLDQRPLLDLNSYYILGMNSGGTISVIDPMIDVAGMTNLYSVILLQSAPDDWAMEPARSRLYTTLPDLNRLEVVDLNAFSVENSVELPSRPERVRLEPGADRVWVTLAGDDGLAVVDTATFDVETVRTAGPGGPLGFSETGQVIVGVADGVLVVDAARRSPVHRIDIGGTATSVAVSDVSGQAYAAVPELGVIAVLDPGLGVETARLAVDPGVSDIAVSPDGVWGVAVNPVAERAYLVHTAENRITHQVPVAGTPDQVVFSASSAYIRTNDSPSITVIPLDGFDPGGDLSVLTVPIGEAPPAAAGTSAAADAIIATPDGRAVLVANPADDRVYLYQEGAERALGGFQGHTLVPRAVEIVDRSIKQPSPGVYTASVRIPTGGDLLVGFLLDSPRMVHCFRFTAQSSEVASASVADATELRVLVDGEMTAGQPYQFRFSLWDGDRDAAHEAMDDVVAMVVQTAGNWSARVRATLEPDGAYRLEFTPPAAGLYRVLVAAPSLGLDFSDLPQTSLQATN